MDNLNNIPNVGNWGDASSKLNDNFNKVKQAVTTVENTTKNNKGYFSSLSALNTAFPSPKAGQTAFVYGEASSTNYYVYNAVNGAWVASSVEAPSIGVDIAGYTKTGGSTKTTKEVEDEVVQLAGDFSVVEKSIKDSLYMPVYDGTNAVNEYSSLIGGWVGGMLSPSNPTSYIRENVNGYLEMKIVASAIADMAYVTEKKIDVTGLHSIEIDMENIGFGYASNLRTRIVLANYRADSYMAGTVILYKTGKFPRDKYIIDISDKTGMYYLQIFISKIEPLSSIYPHLKVYGVNLISKHQSTMDVVKSVESTIPQQYEFAMGYDAAVSTINKVVVDEATGMITFPSNYRIVDRQGNYYSGASGKSVSAKCTEFDTGALRESSFGYLMYNKITEEVRVIYWGDWNKTGSDWLTLAVVKRSTASTTTIGKMLLTTSIAWEYKDKPEADISRDVIARNVDMQAAVNAAIDNKYNASLGASKKRFNFIHFTDNHGDTKLTGNVIKYLNGTPEIDMAINTGDMLAGNFTHSKAVITQMTESVKPILPVLGNHDVGNSMDVAICGDHTEVYNTLIKPFNDKGWIDAQGKNYWFKDFASYKIRLIALYEYDEPLDLNETDSTKYKLWRGMRVYSQMQIDWLINTLINTPSDYHLILLVHQNQQVDNVGVVNVEWNSRNTSIGNSQNYINGDLIPDLIDAWQNGTSINQTYSFLYEASYLPPLSVIADFSSRGLGNFVGYVYGHSHIDIIGTLGKYPSQNFFSCIASINDPANNQWNDLPKVANTKSEDAFNLIAVDTTDRKVFIVRIGANYTNELKERKTLVVSY